LYKFCAVFICIILSVCLSIGFSRVRLIQFKPILYFVALHRFTVSVVGE